MAIGYSALSTMLDKWTENTSTDFLDAKDDIIRLAHVRISKDIDLNVFHKHATASLTDDDPFLTKPTDAIVVMDLHLMTTDSTRHYIQEKDDSWMTEYHPNRTTTGTPKYWSHWDHNTIRVAPTPGNDGWTAEMEYLARPTTLSSSATETWLGNNAEDVVFFGCMLESVMYMKEPTDVIGYWEGRYKASITQLQQEDEARNRITEDRQGEIRRDDRGRRSQS
jgi:hypothetical protein